MQSNIIQEDYVYHCKQVQSAIDWNNCDVIELSDTVTGRKPKEASEVRACWSTDYLYLWFLCKDLNIVSDFEQRDDPLFEQDVIEFFIDEEGTGTRYLELEVSPRNIVFDAVIPSLRFRHLISFSHFIKVYVGRLISIGLTKVLMERENFKRGDLLERSIFIFLLGSARWHLNEQMKRQPLHFPE